MTNYSRSRQTTERYLVTVPRHVATLGWPSCPASGTTPLWVGSQVKLCLDYGEQGDTTYWSERCISSVGTSVLPSYDSILNGLKAKVVQDNYTSYDILTDIAEIKDTFGLVLGVLKAVRRPLQSFYQARKALKRSIRDKEKLNEMIGNLWMHYRYAIMPLCYSAQDIKKTIEDIQVKYKTSRASQLVTVGSASDWDTEQYGPVESFRGIAMYQIVSASIRLGAIGKCRYDYSMSQVRLFDRLGINPFVTAWELIPFSFVVDWFVNLGDWVFAQTAGIADLASQRKFCYTIKEDITADTYLRWNLHTEFRKSYPALGGDVVKKYDDVGVGLLQRDVYTNYTRQLFVPSDITISADVFLNWKRFVDSWVLSSRPLLRGLRSLK